MKRPPGVGDPGRPAAADSLAEAEAAGERHVTRRARRGPVTATRDPEARGPGADRSEVMIAVSDSESPAARDSA